MAAALAVASLETVCAADGQEALQTGKDGAGIVGVEELEGIVHKGGPSLREVEVKDALQDGHQLVAHLILGAGEDGQ